jgi:hypothetical protein
VLAEVSEQAKSGYLAENIATIKRLDRKAFAVSRWAPSRLVDR